METNAIEKQIHFRGRVGTILCMWFLAGMPLSMLLSGIYTLLGVPLPPLYFFLSSLIYLTGGLLGGILSKGSFHPSGFSRPDCIFAFFLFILCVCFLFLRLFFGFIGFQRC